MRERRVWDVDRLQAELNVLGGVAFSAGSLLLFDRALSRWGVVLFVLGSFAMLGGALAVWRARYGRRSRPPQERREGAAAASVTATPAGPDTSAVTPVATPVTTPVSMPVATPVATPTVTAAPTSPAGVLTAPVLLPTPTRSRHSA